MPAPKGFEIGSVFQPRDGCRDALEPRLKQLEDRVEVLVAQHLEDFAQRLDGIEKVVTEILESALGERMEDLENLGEAMARKVKEIDADREAVMEHIGACTLRPAKFEDGGRASLLEAGHRELEVRLAALQEYLAELGVLSNDVYVNRVSRKRFAELRVVSGYEPEATVAHLQAQTRVMSGISTCSSPSSSAALRAASAAFGRDAKLRAASVEEKIRSVFAKAANATAVDECIAGAEELRAATRMAESIGSGDQVYVGGMLLRRLACSELQDAMAKSLKVSELQEAIDKATAAGVDEFELQEATNHLGSLERGREAAKHRLRVAEGWSNSNNPERLQQAILEAERVGVDAVTIRNSRATLATLMAKGQLAPASSSLQDFLQSARPSWQPADLQAVKAKLAKIGILTVEEIGAALQEMGEKSLTEQLRAAHLKVFSAVTLSALQEELARRLEITED